MPREKRTATEVKASIVEKQKQRKAELLKKPVDTVRATITVPRSILKDAKKTKAVHGAVVPVTSEGAKKTKAVHGAVVPVTSEGASGTVPVPKRHAKVMKHASLRITKPVMVRFARTGGCKRLQHMWDTIRTFMMEETRKDVRGAIILTDHNRKKTVSQSHVVEFAARNGNRMYITNIAK